MEQEKEQALTINGFRFGTMDDIELAQQELSAIQYIEHKIENKNTETVLSVYNAALEKRMFRTPIGYSYLHDLQKRMLQNGIEKRNIQGIALYQVYNDDYKKETRPVRIVKQKVKKDEAKEHLRYSLMINIVLGMLVIAMFIIALTGNNPNIINYRYAVENEYSQWEEELKSREETIREKERELNITVPGTEETQAE